MNEFELVDVIRLKALPNNKLWLRFSDGSEGEWDFSYLLAKSGEMLTPLKDTAFFAKAFVEMGAPTWPNGFDVDPTHLHMQMKAAGVLTFKVAA